MSEADDATLPDTRGPPPSSSTIRSAELGDRYRVGELLGRGGMGEVREARDRRFERDVAVKLMRDGRTDEATLARFFREARVQGVLDHPAVVPVHDLGVDAHGNPYFVMKKLAGQTLAEILASTDPAIRANWPRRKLLTRFVDVCFAIQFAHEHRVVHRDLKPGNIMLGEYNDTYVIDWGLARVDGHAEIGNLEPSLHAASGDQTQAGDLLGTPGYMSPEQARGESLDGRSDIFSLGCVLFEILANAPALPRGIAGIDAATTADRLKPSTIATDVPLELDDLCASATAAAPADRPTARELAERLQAYLDGDRDLAKRKEVAELRARRARTALDDKVAGDDAAREVAMREAGGALALDPENTTAASILSYLMMESQRTIPAEALAAADKERAIARKQVLRFAYGGYAGFTALLASLLLFVPLHHSWPVIAALISCGAILLVVHRMNQQLLGMRSPYFVIFMLLNSIALAFAGIVIGPLFLLPWVIIGGISQFVSQPARYPALVIPILFWAPIVALVVLELVGVLPSTFELRDGVFIAKTWVFDLTPAVTATLLIAIAIVQTVNSTLAALSHRRAQEQSQNLLHAHSWHLKQLLPRGSLEAPERPIEPDC